MTERLTPAQLDQLRTIDSATIANAIETFGVRHHTEGYMGMDVRCLTPEFGPMVGYAVTATVDTTSREPHADAKGAKALYRVLADAPKPAVVVLQSISEVPGHSCLVGDVVSTICRRLGAEGVVTDGGVRDLAGIRELGGFRIFAAGIVPSHGMTSWVDVDVPVTLSRVTVHPGDLIHADANGVVTIPHEVAGRLVQATKSVLERESTVKDFVNSPEFTLEGLMGYLKH